MQKPEKSQTSYEPGARVARVVTSSLALMQEQMPRFIADLQILCQIDSPSNDKAGLDQVAEQLAHLLQALDMSTKIVEHPRGNALVGTLQGSAPTAPAILLIGHHDTVHPIGTAEAHTRLTEDKFFAPGTVDMKAGLLQGIYALELLKRQQYTGFSTITFLSVPDEEISHRYHVGLIREIAQQRPLVLGLEGGRSIGNVVTRRKGCAHYTLTAKGRAAHAGSNPEKGLNAVLEIAHQIVQAQSLMGWREGFTINAGPIKGGSLPNVVSDHARIVFDTRFLRPEDRSDAERLWHTLLQQQLVPGVELTLQAAQDSMQPMVATDESLEIARQVQLIAENILHTPFDPETRGGASDCCNTAAAGCPSVDGLGALGGGAHTTNEFVLLSTVPERVALLAGLIASLGS